jgi:hypothetical protein
MGIDKKESYITLNPTNSYMFTAKASMRNDFTTTKPLPSPLALIVLNKLVTLILRIGTKSMTNKERKRQLLLYSARFADAWKDVPFAGNEQLRKDQFGAILPLPLTVLLQYGYINCASAYISDAGSEQDEVREWRMQGTCALKGRGNSLLHARADRVCT